MARITLTKEQLDSMRGAAPLLVAAVEHLVAELAARTAELIATQARNDELRVQVGTYGVALKNSAREMTRLEGQLVVRTKSRDDALTELIKLRAAKLPVVELADARKRIAELEKRLEIARFNQRAMDAEIGRLNGN